MKTFLIQLLIILINVNFVIAQNKAIQINHLKPDSAILKKITKPFNFDKLPIKAERTISFTTDEASYIDVDISPDGKTLLCSFLGELFSIPSTGGNAIQLTRGLAINRAPIWSPDGKYIAYLSDATGINRLHVIDTLGTFHTVLNEDKSQIHNAKQIWLSDSKKIIFDNYIHNISGVNLNVKNEINNIIGFSENYNFIYYVSDTNGKNKLIKLDKTTGDKIIIFELKRNINTRDIANMRISPNGRWLSYIKYNSGSLDSLLLIDLLNNEDKTLAHLNIKLAPPMYYNFCFSKDSKHLFIGYGGKIHRIDPETSNNKIIPFVAKVEIDMGPLNYNTSTISLDSLNAKYIRSINRSPDNKHITFSALNRIHIMDLPNGEPHILTNQDAGQFQPAYSPDGKWIAYVTWNNSEEGHVWKIPTASGPPEQLTRIPGTYLHPSWSPDGKMIILTKKNNQESTENAGQIQIISIENRSVRIIADSVSLNNHPTFSADNKFVIFKPNRIHITSNISPLLEYYDLKENQKKDILFAYIKNSIFPHIRQIILSPDCKNVVFLYNENLYLIPLSYATSPEEKTQDTFPSKLIRFARGATDPSWEEGGKIISWLSANKYCRINPSKIIKAAKYRTPNKSNAGLPELNIIDIDLPPEQVVTINLKVPRLHGKDVIALKNARIITMHNNEIIESGTVLIKNGRFTYVGGSKNVTIPKGAKIVDLKGKSIMPGLIDMHIHLKIFSPPDVIPQQSWQKLINLAYGVTTFRIPSSDFESFGHSELIETGQSIGPRLFTVGEAVRTEYALTSLHEAKIIVNNRVKMGATLIKQYLQPTRLQRQLLLKACKKASVNMTNETEIVPLYWLGMIKDGSTGVEHNPTWGEVYNDFFTLVAKSGTYITPTLQTGILDCKNYFTSIYGKNYLNQSGNLIPTNTKGYLQGQINKSQLDSGFLAKSKINASINKMGGKILMGSHGEYQGIGAHYELWALAMGGLTTYETLKTATITAAEGLGVQNDLGSIEVGKIADLIILDKNPLEDIHNTVTIKYVMKAGILYDKETILAKLK